MAGSIGLPVWRIECLQDWLASLRLIGLSGFGSKTPGNVLGLWIVRSALSIQWTLFAVSLGRLVERCEG